MGVIADLKAGLAKERKAQEKLEIVKAPEFDLTKYAKTVAGLATVVAVGFKPVLKQFGVEADPSDGIVIAIIGAVALILLGAAVVMAADLLARAYVTGAGVQADGRNETADAGETGSEDGESAEQSGAVAAEPGTVAWVENDPKPHPVLAIGTGGKAGSYLLAVGSTVTRPDGADELEAIDGAPKWHPASTIKAIRPAKWP